MNISEPVHPPARRDVAADASRSLLAGALAYRLLPVAPLPQVDFPTISGAGRAARREPGDDGLRGRHAARAPVRPHRRRHRDDLDELARVDARSRCSSTSTATSTRAARDVQAAINAARGQLPAEPAEQSDLPQGQPGRRADHDPGADLGHLTPRPQMYDARRLDPRAEALAGRGRRPGDRRRRRAARGARASSIPTALNQLRHRPRATCAPRSPPPTPTGPKGELADGDAALARSAPTTSCFDGRRVPAADRRLPQRRAGAPRRRRRRSTTRSRTCAPPGSPTASRAVLLIIFRQPGANIIETVDRVQALLPQLRASIPPAIDLRGRHRPHHDHPRLVPRRRAHAADLASRWSILVVFVFLRNVRATLDPERRRAAVAGRHLRRDVPARLQPRQPVADGADHLHRLRGRRRHRRDREHHAPHRGRAMSPLEAALHGRARDRLHRAVDEHRRWSRCSSRSC